MIEDQYISLRGDRIALSLQRVNEPKIAKNRVHLGRLVPDVDAEVERFGELGTRRLAALRQGWFVLANPEG